MKKKTRKVLMLITAAVMIAATIVIPQNGAAYAATQTEPCDYIEGENINCQDYTRYASTVASYLTVKDGGYMRVQAANGTAYIEYYDKDFSRTGKKEVKFDLPYFGAFHETASNYFLITGQNNPEELDTTEVIRITKYDKNWNKIASAGLYGENTCIPFDAGSCRADTSGKFMVIRTCHEMYALSDGLNHQANMTILLNTDTMKVLDCDSEISNYSTGYVSHSFNQFIKIEKNKIVAFDHGDAHPRSAVLINYPGDITGGSTRSGRCTCTDVLEFYGSQGNNDTGASLGGLELMDNKYLVAGCSVIQDERDPDFNADSKTRNVFVASVDKATKETVFSWITDYPDKDVSLSATSTPHLVKIDNSKCLLMWMRDNKVNYATVNENGKLTSEVFTYEGELSDCVPVVSGGRVIWYTWKDETLKFYTVSLSSLSDVNVVQKIYGHAYKIVSANGAEVTLKCTKCGITKSGRVPQDYSIWWRNENSGSTNYYSSIYKMELVDDCKVWIDIDDLSEDSDFNKMVIELEDPGMGTVDQYSPTRALITWKKEGLAVVNIYPKYAPSLKRTRTIRIGDIPLSEKKDGVWVSKNRFTYTGQEIKPEAGINGLKKGTDYEISYKNNINAGTGTIVFTGKGEYKGTIEYNFTIAELNPIFKNSNVVRFAGSSRYGTSAAISAGFISDGQAKAILIVNGQNFPDALAAAPLAHSIGAPILMANGEKGTVDASVIAEINRIDGNHDADIYLIGGEGALDPKINTMLQSMGYPADKIERIEGNDRYLTAIELAKRVDAKTAYIANGNTFPDALGGGSAAALNDGVILFASPTALNAKTADYLKSGGFEKIVILGGTSAVGSNVEAQLKSIAGAQNVKRLSGAGRCETSTAIAREFFPSTDTIVVATAFNFADALAGGPLAADTGAPVILLDTNKKVLTNDLIDYMNSAGVEHVIVLGGEAAVRSELFRAFQGYLK